MHTSPSTNSLSSSSYSSFTTPQDSSKDRQLAELYGLSAFEYDVMQGDSITNSQVSTGLVLLLDRTQSLIATLDNRFNSTLLSTDVSNCNCQMPQDGNAASSNFATDLATLKADLTTSFSNLPSEVTYQNLETGDPSADKTPNYLLAMSFLGENDPAFNQELNNWSAIKPSVSMSQAMGCGSAFAIQSMSTAYPDLMKELSGDIAEYNSGLPTGTDPFLTDFSKALKTPPTTGPYKDIASCADDWDRIVAANLAPTSDHDVSNKLKAHSCNEAELYATWISQQAC